MRPFTAFTKKEFLEHTRSGKLLVLFIIFCLFGIMNPAIAKITPWMMEMLSEELAKNGMTINAVKVDALTSWAQFFKNMPMALIVFLVMFCGILVNEYQKGTLINIVTKGLSRFKIIVAKAFTMFVLWTLGFLISYGITYGYTAYFWDNSIAHNLFFASFCFYLLGMWLITVILLASTIFTSFSSIILSLGGVFLVAYLLALIPALTQLSPTYLMDSANLVTGISSSSDYLTAIIITIVLMCINVVSSILLFNKKNL